MYSWAFRDFFIMQQSALERQSMTNPTTTLVDISIQRLVSGFCTAYTGNSRNRMPVMYIPAG